jgi:hypothetical protein
MCLSPFPRSSPRRFDSRLENTIARQARHGNEVHAATLVCLTARASSGARVSIRVAAPSRVSLLANPE